MVQKPQALFLQYQGRRTWLRGPSGHQLPPHTRGQGKSDPPPPPKLLPGLREKEYHGAAPLEPHLTLSPSLVRPTSRSLGKWEMSVPPPFRSDCRVALACLAGRRGSEGCSAGLLTGGKYSQLRLCAEPQMNTVSFLDSHLYSKIWGLHHHF